MMGAWIRVGSRVASTDVNSPPCAARFGSSRVRLGRSDNNFWCRLLTGRPALAKPARSLLRAWRSKPTQPSPVHGPQPHKRHEKHARAPKQINIRRGLGGWRAPVELAQGLPTNQPTLLVSGGEVARGGDPTTERFLVWLPPVGTSAENFA